VILIGISEGINASQLLIFGRPIIFLSSSFVDRRPAGNPAAGVVEKIIEGFCSSASHDWLETRDAYDKEILGPSSQQESRLLSL